MRIAFIHPDAPGGEGTGATHSATQIVELLREQGHEVTAYCLSDPGDGARGDSGRAHLDLGARPFHWATRLNARLRERAAEFETMDVVHSYLPRSLPAMNHIGRTTSASTVVTLNAYGGVCPKNDLRFLDREPCRENGWIRCVACSVATSGGHGGQSRIYRSAGRIGNLRMVRRAPPGSLVVDGFHALSEHMKRTYAEFGFPADRIGVIPNLLDERFLVDHRSDFSEPYELLYVGSLKTHKGVLLLPELLQRLSRRSAREFRLTVAGEGGARDRLVESLEEKGVAHLASLRGHVPYAELPRLYASHDLFVYPGLWEEPFGRVFLEALAAGTPVVGTDVGAVGEIIGPAGVVTEPTAAALAGAILRMVEGRGLRAYADACRGRAARYSREVVGPAFRELYEKAAGASRARRGS